MTVIIKACDTQSHHIAVEEDKNGAVKVYASRVFSDGTTDSPEAVRYYHSNSRALYLATFRRYCLRYR